ncbi:transposase domain-containing protein [Streptomyces sp. CA-142005]|uniref:transposase domain-containing protein n=1 Tax=Streptomyces sp. CA-142005 TaxID=3240052 RepID=UPI003D8C68C6
MGELTQVGTFEMVDEVLGECGAVQQRLRKLPARVVVYLLLAATLFEECGYPAVWRKLTGALEALPLPTVTATALWHAAPGSARARCGPCSTCCAARPRRSAPPEPAGPGCWWLPSTARTWTSPTMRTCAPGWARGPTSTPAASGYPQVLLVALVACGTRAVIDAVFGPRKPGEPVLGRRLLRSLHQGMVVLLDRGFATNPFLQAVAGTGAGFLARLSAVRKPPILRRFDDGSFLSQIGTVQVRIIECEITISTATGRHSGVYRLATTLLDPHRYPAFELVRLYHERWEVESAYFAVKQSMLGRRVLRARTWPGIAQEIYALLTVYQVIRVAIADATSTVPGADPDRASFSIALHTARDQSVQAAGVIAATTIDLLGAIGRAVLNHLMPTRRLRVSPRAVKRPLSRYAYKSLRVDRRTYKATISIDILLTGPNSP